MSSDEDSDDIPISELRKRKKKKPPPPPSSSSSSSESSEEEDDDDDVPISELAKKRKVAVPKPQPQQQPTTAKKKKSVNFESQFYETSRGMLVQALLRRWWYAIEWPSKEALEKVPEENFEVLPAFPGVHICTSGDRLGTLVDHRDHEKSPCLTNLMKMKTKDIKALVKTAYEVQIKQLTKREPNSPVIKQLTKEMKDADKINPDKADAEAKNAVATYFKMTKGRRG